MQYQQQISLSTGKSINQPKNIIEDSLLQFLNESNYLEIESSQENHQKLINCQTEPILQTKESCISNSYTLSNNKFNFLTYEILEWETLYNTLPSEIYHFLTLLKSQCYTGTIIYTIEQIDGLIKQSQINIKNQLEFFNQILDKGWISKKIRNFNGTKINFYALAVKKLTYENLFWVIKSIKKDLITPTERLVQSRIKECYGFKYSRYEWNHIINYIKSSKQVTKFGSSFGKSVELPIIQVIKIKDPLIQEETQGIYFQKQNWHVEDEFQQDLDQKQEWNIFIEYLQSIFDKNSVQNNKILKSGRYGCAQFIKLLGPKKLRELSLGRLTLYMQMAVNKNHIRNTKTVLVQDNREKSEYTTDSSLDGDPYIKMKIKELQEQLIQLLLENLDGVLLTQIPTLLKKRVSFELNLIELGFPKLRNFIETVKDVIQIENNGRNNVIAKLNQTKFWNKNQNLLKNILSKHKYGISINQLYYDLSQLLGEWFNYQKFQCQSFFQFLQNYAENILIIVCQKGNQYLIYEKDLRFLPPPTSRYEINDQQFDHILSETFQCNFGFSFLQSSFSNSWLGKAEDSKLRYKSLQGIEDSHQEIKENLKFIDEMLGYEKIQNETYSIQDWSEKSMNPLEMLSSINYGYSEIQTDFDLTKELQISLSQQAPQQSIQQQESKKY
ncbi:unnamed protein product [Paramecium pentaurelia]|uniref:HTH OST-type domain-containing protein n=1 Tax=Paramecium pentaurelia TaxID=43138 RepID=A0A8S1SNF7_9CILI|nr:unnamed protein product [Paramecium pentaurelia]